MVKYLNDYKLILFRCYKISMCCIFFTFSALKSNQIQNTSLIYKLTLLKCYQHNVLIRVEFKIRIKWIQFEPWLNNSNPIYGSINWLISTRIDPNKSVNYFFSKRGIKHLQIFHQNWVSAHLFLILCDIICIILYLQLSCVIIYECDSFFLISIIFIS